MDLKVLFILPQPKRKAFTKTLLRLRSGLRQDPIAPIVNKIVLAMKLTTILLLACALQVSAKGHAQITLILKNAPLPKVLNEIEKQSGVSFIYKKELIETAGKISLNVNNQPLKAVLDLIFKNQPVDYKVSDKYVVLSPKPTAMLQTAVSPPADDNPPPPIDIHGRVLDEKGQPLVGVTVKVKGRNIATATNGNGEFTLKSVDENAILQFTSVNMEQLEVKVSGKTEFAISLKTKVTTNEVVTVVVNTGFQQLSPERVTGAFDIITKEQIQKPATSIASRLYGTTAGMQIKQDADGNASIEVRGQTTLFANTGASIAAGNNPLIVVDGFPIRGTIDPFTTLNPNDVESITVLKDAGAASIWGARAANGVIVITTKKGSRNTPLKIEFSAFIRVASKQDVGYLTGFASSSETVDFEQLAFDKWGARQIPNSFSNNYFRLSQATVFMNEKKLGFLSDAQLTDSLNKLRNVDNRKDISDYLLAKPVNQQINLTISGGGQRSTSLISMLAERDQSNFVGTHNYKYALNYRTNYNVTKWLDFYLSSTYQNEKFTSNGVGPGTIQTISPYQSLKNPDGSLTNIYQYYQPILDRFVPQSKFPYSFFYNPIQDIAGTDRTQTYITTRIQAGLTFKILKGLTYTPKFQYQNVNIFNRTYLSDQTFAVRNFINQAASWTPQQLTGTVTSNIPLGGRLDEDRTSVEIFNLRNQLNFSRVFSKNHELNIIAGTEVTSSVSKNTTNPTVYGYNDDKLTVGTLPASGATNGWTGNGNFFSGTSSFSYSTQRFYSLFANTAYTYKDKYTVSGSYRTDASNLIASDPKYRYSPFYSAGIGYEISKEKFMQSVSWINRLNLRGTYGYNGNVDNSSSPYVLINLRANPNVFTGSNTATISTIGNPTLTWEKTRTINLGMDYTLLNNKLYGKVDVYDKLGKNLFAQIAVPSVVGATSQKFNNAAMENKGIEFTIGTNLPILGNKITWNGNFNASYNKNKILTLFNTSYQARSIVSTGSTGAYVEGANSNSVWAYQYAGLVNGQPMFQGPGGIPLPLTSIPVSDARTFLTNIGTTDAPWNFGMRNSFKIYDFDFSFIVIAKIGAIFRGQYFNYPRSGVPIFPNSKLSGVLNGDPNTILTLPTNPNDITYGTWINFYPNFSYNYLNASLLRMQEINLTYNLPLKWISRVGFHNASVIVQANNVFTILANKTGEDPDYPKGATNIGAKPKAQYTFGVKFDL